MAATLLWQEIARDTSMSLPSADKERSQEGVLPCIVVRGWSTYVSPKRRCPCLTYCPCLKINYTGFDINALIITITIFFSDHLCSLPGRKCAV